MKIDASYEAGTFIRERGGGLYIWLKPASRRSAFGTVKVTTRRPPADVELRRHEAGGFELYYDTTLPEADRLKIELRRFPWRRLRVSGVGGELPFGGGDGGWGGDGGGGNGGGG